MSHTAGWPRSQTDSSSSMARAAQAEYICSVPHPSALRPTAAISFVHSLLVHSHCILPPAQVLHGKEPSPDDCHKYTACCTTHAHVPLPRQRHPIIPPSRHPLSSKLRSTLSASRFTLLEVHKVPTAPSSKGVSFAHPRQPDAALFRRRR